MRKLLILLVASAFIVGLAGPAMALYGDEDMEVHWYGSVLFNTYWTDTDGELTTGPTAVTRDDYDDTEINWADNASRIGVWFKKGPLKARFEFREGSGVFYRFHAEWNFGPGTLWIGRDDHLIFNPTDFFQAPPRSANAGISKGTGTYDSIRLIFPIGPARLSIGAFTPTQAQAFVLGGNCYDTDKELPALEAKVDFKIGPVAMAVFGGWNSYSEVTTLNKEYDIDSHLIGIVARYNAGPFGLHASIQRDENMYMSYPPPWPSHKAVFAGVAGPYNAGKPTYNPATDSIVDTTDIGWHIGAQYVLNDSFSIVAGYGENSVEDDYSPSNEEEASSWWISIPIKITEFFSIYPNYVVTDWEDCSSGPFTVDRGKVRMYGMHWIIEW